MKEAVAAVDLAAVICSFSSFVFASSLCILLWRVRKKEDKTYQKRSAILLTTHVYYMAICDILLSIWCILTYVPAVLNTNFLFFGDPLEEDINHLSFGSIEDNIPCFLLAVLGQFASVGSATWYIMISYCLWRILFGHNPLSLSMKKKHIKSANANLKSTTRNIKIIRKTKDENKQNGDYLKPYKISPVKEDESMEYKKIPENSENSNTKQPEIISNEGTRAISPNDFLNLPTAPSYNNHNNNNNSSEISSWSSWSVDAEKDKDKDKNKDNPLAAFNKEHQIREKQEMAKIVKRHHLVVWSITIFLTFIPFSTSSFGIIDVSYIGDTERKLECWIGTKFWAFSFYSVITIAVLSAICLLLFISFKILRKKFKNWWKEFKRQRKQKKRDEVIKIYNNKGSSVSLYGHNERASSGASYLFSSESNRSPVTYYKKEWWLLKRFGVFVGCYLLCWTLPVIRRYYALIIDDHLYDVPDWLILSSEITIAIFPMANAIVWYTNPSFRKLISKNLHIVIRYHCFCPYSSRKYTLNAEQYNNNNNNNNNNHDDKTQLTKYEQLKSSIDKTNNNTKTLSNNNKTQQKSIGGVSGQTTPNGYGSFCDIIDLATYSHFTYPNMTNKTNDNGVLQPSSFPKFKRMIGSIDSSGYRNDEKEEDEDEQSTEDDISSVETIENVAELQHHSIAQLTEHFEKYAVRKGKYSVTDIGFSTLTMPSHSTSLSDEMRRENQKYSSDFTYTDIDGVRTPHRSPWKSPYKTPQRNSIINNEFKLEEEDEDELEQSKLSMHEHTKTDSMNNEYIKELAKHCYYGSDGNMKFLNITPSDNITPQSATNRNKQILNHISNKSPNSNFVNGLFSDDEEEYDNQLKRFKNSINEFDDDEDYGLFSDDNMEYDAINVNEDHFGLKNDNDGN